VAFISAAIGAAVAGVVGDPLGQPSPKGHGLGLACQVAGKTSGCAKVQIGPNQEPLARENCLLRKR
jgi:hypothetical protein